MRTDPLFIITLDADVDREEQRLRRAREEVAAAERELDLVRERRARYLETGELIDPDELRARTAETIVRDRARRIAGDHHLGRSGKVASLVESVLVTKPEMPDKQVAEKVRGWLRD